jgi:hypothetical protein
LYSQYSHYDKDQAALLARVARGFSVYHSIFYLWYNPPSSGFSEDDAKILRAYEAHSGAYRFDRKRHAFWEEMMEFGIAFSGNSDTKEVAGQAAEQAWRARQPALRVSSLGVVLAEAKDRTPPQLLQLYKRLVKSKHRQFSDFEFAPFANLFVFGLFNDYIGSTETQWLQLVEGAKVPLPPMKGEASDEDSMTLSNLMNVPAPRHTLTLTLRSTLPHFG